jgi:hypothetical protein
MSDSARARAAHDSQSLGELFTGRGAAPGFLPDLTLWHRWHSGRGSLPSRWKGRGLAEICADLGVPVWRPAAPWLMETPGIEVRTTESAAERITRWTTPSRVLEARWTRGPDGDWWQSEYPVKTADDLEAGLRIVRARRYVVDPARAAALGPAAVLELPLRPFSDILHTLIGWTEGLMLLLEAPEAIGGMVEELEGKLQTLAIQMARMGPALVLSPDNLDSQFISAAAFERHMKASYRTTADTLHAVGARLVVHVGGPIRGLLPALAASGVDAIEGICGAPQSDAGLAQARGICGPGPTLWGGIAQDLLLAAQDEASFERTLAQAIEEAAADGNAIVGVADRVPVDALPDRLERIARRVREAE